MNAEGGTVKLTQKEEDQLIKILECSNEKLDEKLQNFREAATEEYLRMILGQRVFTRGQDMTEYRLFLMIKHVFTEALPTEQQISALFQTTATQSRSLLRAVMSKYQYELQPSVDATLDAVLKSAEKEKGTSKRKITVDSENIVDALNRRIATIDGTLPQIAKSRGTISTYEIAESAYHKLTEK